ncbi:MAG: NirD/YgiW/YdeI family stress tolerance protein [Aliivibrio sp.]|nr:NirD/YgiW/YdeI family stress tolerance protein [Aliivibrio sp.]
MKKIISTLIVTASLFSASVLANPYQGYQPASSIAALQSMPYVDDMPVNLSGKLGQQVGPEHFQFTDSTGTAIVEIDHEEQFHFGIKAGQQISFFGEAEKEYGRLEIELKFVNNGQAVQG